MLAPPTTMDDVTVPQMYYTTQERIHTYNTEHMYTTIGTLLVPTTTPHIYKQEPCPGGHIGLKMNYHQRFGQCVSHSKGIKTPYRCVCVCVCVCISVCLCNEPLETRCEKLSADFVDTHTQEREKRERCCIQAPRCETFNAKHTRIRNTHTVYDANNFCTPRCTSSYIISSLLIHWGSWNHFLDMQDIKNT